MKLILLQLIAQDHCQNIGQSILLDAVRIVALVEHVLVYLIVRKCAVAQITMWYTLRLEHLIS